MPPLMRFVDDRVLMGVIARGITHTVDVGAAGLAAAVENPRYGGGAFYGSAAHTLTGDVVDQSTIFPQIADQTLQDNANEAIHRFRRFRSSDA